MNSHPLDLARSSRSIGIAGFVCALALLWPTLAWSQTRDPNFPETCIENDDQAFDRLVMSFDQAYADHTTENQERLLDDGMTVYYLRRELQGLVDMWRATGDTTYLEFAKSLTLQAIDEATANRRPLIWHDEIRGAWPCFYLSTVEEATGGHNQLCDFQGSVGFLMVARALREVRDPAAGDITAFVEEQIVEKWLYYNPSTTTRQMQGPESFQNVLAILNTGRDVREQFACVCLDLHGLRSQRYDYRGWAERLINLYLAVRYDPNEPAPESEGIEHLIGDTWGLLPQVADERYTWLLVPNYEPDQSVPAIDTSHGNRTAWLAARAYAEGLVDKTVLGGLLNTLEFRIWAPEKGPFYFNNYTDGSDGELNGLGPGRGGNVWFGWHRLAAYDPELETLFLCLALDLTYGGPNLPDKAQNKTMANAPLSLEAWGARLLAPEGQAYSFP
jgi:hypothetical protein